MRPHLYRTIASVLASVLLTLLTSDRTSGQIVYEPPISQFGGQNPYYYGGADPLVHRLARSVVDASGSFGRANGFEFISSRRLVERQQTRVFIDGLGYRNAASHGATINDAHNDRMARLPGYFAKRDQLAAALQIAPVNGSIAVPANGYRIGSLYMPGSTGHILIKPGKPVGGSKAGRVYVFPKSLLDRRLDQIVGDDALRVAVD